MAHAGSTSTVGGGEWCGLCISRCAVCTGSGPCNMSPFPLLFIHPHTLPQPAIIYDQLFKMLPPLPLVTWLLPSSTSLRKVNTDWWGKSNSVLEMRRKPGKYRKSIPYGKRQAFCSFYCALCIKTHYLLQVWGSLMHSLPRGFELFFQEWR